MNRLTSDEPTSEPGIIHGLSKRIESGSQVFVGNSLPIREWDFAATFEPRGLEVFASRGLNGIDGQISAFLGMCLDDRPNWAILGDLTALYDLAGPWISRQLDPSIFSNNRCDQQLRRAGFLSGCFPNLSSLIRTMSASGIGQKCGDSSYQLCTSVSRQIGGIPSKPGQRVIQLRPDAAATVRFWDGHSEAMR